MKTRTTLGRAERTSFTRIDGTLTGETMYPLLDEHGNVLRYLTLEAGNAYIAAKYGAVAS